MACAGDLYLASCDSTTRVHLVILGGSAECNGHVYSAVWWDGVISKFITRVHDVRDGRCVQTDYSRLRAAASVEVWSSSEQEQRSAPRTKRHTFKGAVALYNTYSITSFTR